MATMDASQVTVGSAKATGAIWTAPEGTTLPADATTALSSTWVLLGFTSDAGVTIAENTSSESIRAWEDRTEVLTIHTEYSETVSFTPIQCNADVAKLTWGEDHVTVSQDGSIYAKHHGGTMTPVAIVVETSPAVGIVKRYCGTFRLTERGEATMDGTQVDARQLTFTSVADSNGVTVHEHTAYTTGTTS